MDLVDLENAQKEAVKLISSLEGFKSEAYKDIAGVVTLGFGSTTDDHGIHFQMGQTCTLSQAKQYLNYHLQKFVYPELTIYDLPPHIYGSCSSLSYNVGHLGPSLCNILELKKWDKLPEAFREYIVVDGRVSVGLKNRREQEISFMKDECHV